MRANQNKIIGRAGDATSASTVSDVLQGALR